MAITPPQQRAVDPYSSYNSDNVNKLTRILSQGYDVVAQGLSVVRDATSNVTITLTGGVCTKDDVMINVMDDTVLNIHDSTCFFDSAVGEGETIEIYLVLEYVYDKITPAPVAKIGFLRNKAGFNTTAYLFLAWLDIRSGQIFDVLESDPSVPSAIKKFPSVYFSHISTRPTWSREYIGKGFVVDNREIIIGGNENIRDWVYFDSDTSSMLDVVYIEGTHPPYWSATEKGKIYDEGGNTFYIGSGVDEAYHQLSQGIYSLNGIYNNGGNITLQANGINIVGGVYDPINPLYDWHWLRFDSQSPVTIGGISAPAGEILFIEDANESIRITSDNGDAKSITFKAINNIESINGITKNVGEDTGATVQILTSRGLNVITDTEDKTITITTTGGGIQNVIPGAFHDTFLAATHDTTTGLYYVDVDHSTVHTAGTGIDTTGFVTISIFDAADAYELIPYDIEKRNVSVARVWFNSQIPTEGIHALGVCPQHHVDSTDKKYSGFILSSMWTAELDGSFSYIVSHNMDSTNTICITRLFDIDTCRQVVPYAVCDITTNKTKIYVSSRINASVTILGNSSYGNRYVIDESSFIATADTGFGTYYVDIEHDSLKNIVGFISQIQDVNNWQIFPSGIQGISTTITRIWFDDIPSDLPLTVMLLTPVYLGTEISLAWTTTAIVESNQFDGKFWWFTDSTSFYIDIEHGMDTDEPLGVFAYKNTTKRSISVRAVDLVIPAIVGDPAAPVGYVEGNWIRVWLASHPNNDVIFRILK